MIAFDTNVLARLVVEDDQQHFELANRWLRRSATLTFDAALRDEEGFTWLDASAEDASGSRES